MKFKVQFALAEKPKYPLQTGFRPDWVSEKKPRPNCARVLLEADQTLEPMQNYICHIEPLVPSYWKDVKVNDVLKCVQGSNQLGEATVIEVVE